MVHVADATLKGSKKSPTAPFCLECVTKEVGSNDLFNTLELFYHPFLHLSTLPADHFDHGNFKCGLTSLLLGFKRREGPKQALRSLILSWLTSRR